MYGSAYGGRAKSQIYIPREIGESQDSVLLPDTREKSSEWRVKDGKLSGAEVNGWRTALMEESWDDSRHSCLTENLHSRMEKPRDLIEGGFGAESLGSWIPAEEHAQPENALMTTVLL